MNKEDLNLECKLWTKLRVKDGKLMISNVANPKLLEYNNQRFDMNKLKNDVNEPDNEVEYGDSKEYTQNYLVKTDLSERSRVFLFAKNQESHPKIVLHDGPAGTGKTETCKDWARVYGFDCVVVNVHDQMKVSDVEPLFKKQGNGKTMFCFDEANRLHNDEMQKIFTLIKNTKKEDLYLVCFTFNSH